MSRFVLRLALLGLIIGLIGAFWMWFYQVITTPKPHDTEMTCINQYGEVVFYASGFKPSEHPIVRLNSKRHKNVEVQHSDGNVLATMCRSTWGGTKPRGIDFGKNETSRGKHE